jgi:3-phenylpropionate/cinnamic acid dioxygenase small subunit
MAKTSLSDAARRQIADLNDSYIRSIDDDRLEAWPALFTEKCLYRITTRENFARGFAMPLMEAISRGMLIDRVTGYRRVNVYEPHRYTHMVSGLSIETADGERVTCRQNYLVIRTMINGEMTVFSAGVYYDKIVLGADSALFEERIVVQESCRVDTLLVIPL